MNKLEIAAIQKEMDEMMAKFNKAKEENTVSGDFPKLTKKYTYRKSQVIKTNDLAAL